MTAVVTEAIAKDALQLVKEFFDGIPGPERDALPKVLKSPGSWVASYEGSTLGVFFLTRAELQRATEYQNRGWQTFPGFIISEDQKPAKAPVAVAIGGSCNFFASNHTTNMFAFSVKPGASFTVVDHFHEIKDSSSGEEFKYHVDLAFILGIDQGEQRDRVKLRLHELLKHTMGVWKTLHES